MKKKAAFTLLELIVSLAIVSMLVFLISSMIGLNYKISNAIFKDDKSYKESINAMLYVENVVREADKIEITDDTTCNFIASLKGSKYWFYYDKDSKKLKVKINGSKGEGYNWIGTINDMILTYDGDKEVFLWMEAVNGEIYQTRINIGERK
ncbi:MAG: type II secretion system protein [Peptoniphilaceae bacterium]|nr:type II secretion system protein [Peptoniphilaceae bacterium]